jgi:CHAT domain-containing protein
MRAFYAALRDTRGDAATSLQRARLDVRKVAMYRDPYFWAGFFVAGGDR